jgi:HSP20 family protein
VNIERMRREMDELFGDWSSQRASARRPAGFSPRVDVYLCRSDERGGSPRVVVKADLAGVDPDAVNLEISGHELLISGERPVRETEGRAYQQVEIPTGRFRRSIELGIDVVASEAKATFEDGILRIELPVRMEEPDVRRVPIERVE